MAKSQPSTKRPSKQKKQKARYGGAKKGSPKAVFSAQKANPRKKK